MSGTAIIILLAASLMVAVYRMLRLSRRLAVLEERRDTLWSSIQHGDTKHRVWLFNAIAAHFAGERVLREHPGTPAEF